jgi:hypothetical protein
MSTDRMSYQKSELLGLLDRHGWQRAAIIEPSEWWADDIWLMRSTWSPQASEFHLTFLVDPQAETRQRAPGGSVWAVKASIRTAERWQQSDGEITLELGAGWKDRFEPFAAAVSRFRDDRS